MANLSGLQEGTCSGGQDVLNRLAKKRAAKTTSFNVARSKVRLEGPLEQSTVRSDLIQSRPDEAQNAISTRETNGDRYPEHQEPPPSNLECGPTTASSGMVDDKAMAEFLALSGPALKTPRDASRRNITRLADGSILKVGKRVRWEEYEALKFAHDLNLPVPRVLEAQKLPNGETSIRMEFIEGECLTDAWKQVSMDEKRDICQQLRVILGTMRSLPSPTGQICSCGGGPAHDGRSLLHYSGGPFSTEADFNSFLLDLYRATPVPIRNALQRALPSHHLTVFTHGDLHQDNIIVKDNKIQALLDWEYAGWYPEHWEYLKFFERHAENRDWKDSAEYIFSQCYDEELLLHQALARWQRQ